MSLYEPTPRLIRAPCSTNRPTLEVRIEWGLRAGGITGAWEEIPQGGGEALFNGIS